MNKSEVKILCVLSAIFSFRVFGLMMVLPVLPLHMGHYLGSNKLLLGVAIGIYGLFQGLLQIPFSMVSDKIGRFKVIIFGLVLFLIGSIIAYYSTTIYMLIFARALQGSGAIGGTILAMLADNTAVESRTVAMAVIGITIGGSFFAAVLVGPALAANFGLHSIFFISFVLGILAIILAITMLPKQGVSDISNTHYYRTICTLLAMRKLQKMYFGIWLLHLSYTATFVVIPIILVEKMGINIHEHWHFYATSLLCSVLFSGVTIRFLDNAFHVLYPASICVYGLAIVGIIFSANQYYALFACMTMFFAAFTVLESILPSLTSRYTSIQNRGATMGLFSTFQFLGIFSGGVISGMTYFLSLQASLVGVAILIILWFIATHSLRQPVFSHYTFSIVLQKTHEKIVYNALFSLVGIGEVVYNHTEHTLCVKVDDTVCDICDVEAIIQKYQL